MRYVGGKSRLAGRIASVVEQYRPDNATHYLEPFVGGGATLERIGPAFEVVYGGDVVPDLMAMWTALLVDGGEPPLVVSRKQYEMMRYQRDTTPSALRGFVGLGGSFGGKWWGGYAQGGHNSDGTPRNHQAESARNLIKTRDLLSHIKLDLRCQSYESWESIVGSDLVIYADPPYADTTGYKAAGTFDSRIFWPTMKRWAKLGATVFVSEYEAPAGWTCVWEASHRESLRKEARSSVSASVRPVTTERLFVYAGSAK